MGKFGEHYNSSRTFNGIDEKFEQLNADFVTSIEEVLKKEPSAVLVPLMKDYLVRTQKTFETYNIGPKQKEGLMGFEKLGVFFQELEGDWSEMTENSVMMQVAAKAPKAKKRTHAESPDVEVHTLAKNSKPTTTATTAFPVFTFGAPQPAAAPGAFAGFSFTAPPMQPVTQQPEPAAQQPSTSKQSSETEKDKEEEDEEQEKYEVKPVVESDSLFSARCKVFSMVNGQYKDKGVGQLYVKKLESGKHQAVVRADNNLGTILLNLLLQKGLPLKKKSAKDVMTVDPVGDAGKPMTILLRVKNEEESTKLLENLEKFANLSS